MQKPFKPLLALSEEVSSRLHELKFPLLASVKLDGIRCTNHSGVSKSRKMIDIPNEFIQAELNRPEYHNLDGELIVGDPTAPDCYNATQSAVMRVKGEPDFRFYVFDNFSNPGIPFHERLGSLPDDDGGRSVVVSQRLINDVTQLLSYEDAVLSDGHEGLILRSLNGLYKFGRSTWNEHYALKLKRFTDDEGDVVGFAEGMTNTNEKVKDNLGNGKRSSHAEGMIPAGTLGKFLVSFKGEVIDVPCGVLKHAERLYIWEHQDEFLGKLLKFRHFTVGAMLRPRMPRFIGWRSAGDLS